MICPKRTCPCKKLTYNGEMCFIRAGDNYKFAPIECLKKHPELLGKYRKWEEDEDINSPNRIEARKFIIECVRYGLM